MGTARERRLTPRGAATRQRILEAAADLVHLRGAACMSLDDIMEATGASRSQLYHYFDDKEGLVRDVIAFQTRRILDAKRCPPRASRFLAKPCGPGARC